jgi:hypothetical protein
MYKFKPLIYCICISGIKYFSAIYKTNKLNHKLRVIVRVAGTDLEGYARKMLKPYVYYYNSPGPLTYIHRLGC